MERNVTSDSLKKVGRLPAYAFSRITGHMTTPGSGLATRAPNTYIRVDLSHVNNLPSSLRLEKVHILIRTALRNWLRKSLADKYIYDFLVNNNIIPPWIDPEAASNTGYLSLQYPLLSYTSPSLIAITARANPRAVMPARPAVASNEIDSLTAKMDKLLAYLVKDRKLQQEDRRFLS